MADDTENSAKDNYETCPRCGGPNDRLRSAQRDWRMASTCRKCHAAYMRAWRRLKPSKGKSTEARRKAIARSIAGANLRRGKIERQRCTVCGSLDSQMHHPDYAKPLEVVWFCPEHHRQFHRLRGR